MSWIFPSLHMLTPQDRCEYDRCDSEIIIGSHGEGTGNDLPYEVRCLSSYLQLSFLVLVHDVGDFGEDELRGDANLDKVLHDLAKYTNPVHSFK